MIELIFIELKSISNKNLKILLKKLLIYINSLFLTLI